MTTITQVQLVASVQLGDSDATVYTSPALTTSKIGRPVFCNNSGSTVTITAGITTGGALTGIALINARPLAPNESYTAPELAGAVIPAGSVIRAYASAAAAVAFEASGIIIQ